MTIHAAMGDTLVSMATTVSASDNHFSLWDKGQLIVILSRTKEAKQSIFVGPKQDTLDAFRRLLKVRTQWSDHVEEVLRLITMGEESSSRIMRANNFPYRIKDIQLPTVIADLCICWDQSGYHITLTLALQLI